MEEKKDRFINTCDFRDVNPIMVALPYPQIEVQEKNPGYAQMLSHDYAGAVSEMTAIAQYINNEHRLSYENCPLARTILGIAVAEMIHLQKLGELICLLGGNLEFGVRQRDARIRFWTPQYLECPQNLREMLQVDMKAERAAINQYRTHIKAINDSSVNAVLERIILDEEYHIMILEAMD